MVESNFPKYLGPGIQPTCLRSTLTVQPSNDFFHSSTSRRGMAGRTQHHDFNLDLFSYTLSTITTFTFDDINGMATSMDHSVPSSGYNRGGP